MFGGQVVHDVKQNATQLDTNRGISCQTYRFIFIYSKQLKLFEPHLDLYQSFFTKAWNYSMTVWLSLSVHSGSLKRIDHPK